MMRTLAAILLLAAAPAAHAVTVTVGDSTAPWQGFMNVFELPENGGGFVFPSGWGVPDLTATFNDPASTVTLSPNTIGDPNEFWYQNTSGLATAPNFGGPGQRGNKVMEANLFLQVDDGSLSGQTVTFEGVVLSNTYTAAHSASIFIRDFAPGFGSFTETIIPATVGPFSISLVTDPGAGRTVQYGFQSRGENVWVTDTAPFGNVVFGPSSVVPEPASVLVAGVALAAGAASRRRG